MEQNNLETIKHVGTANVAVELNKQLEEAGMNAVAVVRDITIESTEEYLDTPPHFKALFETPVIEEFAGYTNEQPSSTVFVSNQNMSAQAIFDIGTPEEPLNRFHKASITLEQTADYTTLLNANQARLNQRAFAMWLEEHHSKIQAFGKESAPGMDAPVIEMAKAIHAIRNTKVTTATQSDSKIEDLSEQQSVMAQVEVQNKDGNKPIYLDYTCVPFHGLKLPLQAANQNDDENMQRTFRIRINTITDGEKPAFSLSIMNLEQHKEIMVEAFKKQLKDELKDHVTVRIGTFK